MLTNSVKQLFKNRSLLNNKKSIRAFSSDHGPAPKAPNGL